MDFNGNYNLTPDALEGQNSFITRVFGWMVFGVLLTAGASFGLAAAAASNESLMALVTGPVFMVTVIIAELALVIGLSAGIRKLSASAARMMFLLYSVLSGLSLFPIFYVYTGSAIGIAFIYAAVFFGVMCLYGYFTKADLTSLGRILIVGLFAVIIASVINIFVGSSTAEFIVCIAGLAIFVGLTAYDMQKIKTYYYEAASGRGVEETSKIAVIGALTLYLDFINMFLYILRLLGRRK